LEAAGHAARGTGSQAAPGTTLVWDVPVRVAHWALAALVAGAWATHYAGTQWFDWHRRLGYATLVIVAFRIVWGFVGTRHARFASFVRGPRAIFEYVRGGARADAAGHNPLGALSVLALLALLLVQATTGLFANDEIASAGPFYGWTTHEQSNRIASLHRVNSKWLLALVVLHVVAVAWYSRVRRQPLVRAMLTGRRDSRVAPPDAAIKESGILRAMLIVAVLAAVLVLAIRAAPDAAIALF
jgi:cytochrome b